MTSCNNTGAVANSTAAPIAPQDVHRLMGRAGVECVDPRPLGLIVRTTGKIRGARLIPIDDIEAGRLPPAFVDRSLHIITTCQSGPMAHRAAAAFARMGFAKVSWLEGGTQGWLDAGFETIR